MVIRILIAVLCFGMGFLVGGTDLGGRTSRSMRRAAVGTVATNLDLELRARVLAENPEIMAAISRGGGFGGRQSLAVAQNMFGRTDDAILDAKEMTRVIETAPRTWLVRLPVVNAAVFETDEGLVVVDTGMAPGGPALMTAIRKVSDAPVHTIIYTHGHVDHAYGTWAILAAGEKPREIIAHENLPPRFERYIRLRGSLARYMSQPEEQLPARREDLVWPTRTFDDRLEIVVGGERFVLVHHPAETDDQLYVWVPGRKALASADYYQGFLPNAGNGKRVQRDPEQWVVALREMAALGAEVLLPAHGEEILDRELIRTNFSILADALESVIDQTIEGLNAGRRKDQIFASVELPDHLANHPTLNVQYVTAQDISKMVIRRYTGWWDDIPSHWTPAPMEDQGYEIAQLAGGPAALAARALALAAEGQLRMACHMVDWAFLAAPEDPKVQEAVIEVYVDRIVDPASNTQEILAYLDQIMAARAQQLSRDAGA